MWDVPVNKYTERERLTLGIKFKEEEYQSKERESHHATESWDKAQLKYG
jgi:hypothetical protein